MQVVSRIAAFVLMGFLLSLPALSAEGKDKKADPKKDDPAKNSTVKKADDKKDTDKEKDKPAEKMLPVRTVIGKVMAVVEAKKSLRVQLTVAKNKTVDVEWQAIDDVKVRFDEAALPPKFDDKGRIKRYTRKDLNELKGDDKKTRGYPAEFSDLKQGQIVEVTLVRKKGSPKRVKGADADPAGEYLPHMSFIVIVANPQQ